MVVDGGQVKAQVDAFQPGIDQVVVSPLVNVSLGLDLVVVGETVHLRINAESEEVAGEGKSGEGDQGSGAG